MTFLLALSMLSFPALALVVARRAPEDDVDRLLRLDLQRRKRDAALRQPTRWAGR